MAVMVIELPVEAAASKLYLSSRLREEREADFSKLWTRGPLRT